MGKRSEVHKDAKSRGVASSDVSKLRQTEMKGTMIRAPRAFRAGARKILARARSARALGARSALSALEIGARAPLARAPRSARVQYMNFS